MRSIHLINPAAITILEVVSDLPGCTQRDIQRETAMAYETVAQYVKMLHTNGLLEIRQGDVVMHRNAYTINLTDNGRSAIEILNSLEDIMATSTPANGAQWSDAC